MNWAFFLVRFVIIVGILSLFFLSQRFWHRAIWRSTANFRSQWLRVAARLLWLTMIFLVICAFIDGVRMDHRHLIPRGTLVSALVGLWFFSAVFGFVAVKLVRGVDLLWSRIRKRMQSATGRCGSATWRQSREHGECRTAPRSGAALFFPCRYRRSRGCAIPRRDVRLRGRAP